MKAMALIIGIGLLASGIAYAKPDAVPGVACTACHVGNPAKKQLTEKASKMLAQAKDVNKCKDCHVKGDGGKLALKAQGK